MGLYDNLVDDDKSLEAQVKCWGCDMDTFRPGDTVPQPGTYSIALMEGGWANVVDGVFVGFADDPTFEERIDKWGGFWDPDKDVYGENHPYKLMGEKMMRQHEAREAK